MVTSTVTRVTELIEPTVQALGLELWGIEYFQKGRSPLIRIYIERDQGITIEDCERVSRQVSALLDVEDPITGEYTLEVSSPGLERPLFTVQHFEKYAGSQVKLRMKHPVDGRRKFNGSIVKIDGDNICLRVDEAEFELPHSDIEKANVVYE